MSDKAKKKLIGTNLFWITSIGITFFLGSYTYWGIIKPAEDKSDWVWVDIEDALPPGRPIAESKRDNPNTSASRCRSAELF